MMSEAPVITKDLAGCAHARILRHAINVTEKGVTTVIDKGTSVDAIFCRDPQGQWYVVLVRWDARQLDRSRRFWTRDGAVRWLNRHTRRP